MWKLAYSELSYIVSRAWDGPVSTRQGYLQHTLADNSDSNIVVVSVVWFSCRGIMDGTIYDRVCHNVCLCNLPSFLEMYATEHLQKLDLLDHTHKNISFLWIVTVASLRCHLQCWQRWHYINVLA